MDADHVFAKNLRLKKNPRDVKTAKLLNAQLMALEHPESFFLPSASAIKKVKPGDFVKVSMPRERFWVRVSGFQGRKWYGQVANELIYYDLKMGDSIQFYRKNIYDVEYQ